MSDAGLSERLALAGVVATVDAVNGLATLDAPPRVRQAGGGRRPADADQDRSAARRSRPAWPPVLRPSIPSATHLQASFGDVDPARLFDMGLGAAARAATAMCRRGSASTRTLTGSARLTHDHAAAMPRISPPSPSCASSRSAPSPSRCCWRRWPSMRRRSAAAQGLRQRRREPRPSRGDPRRAARVPSARLARALALRRPPYPARVHHARHPASLDRGVARGRRGGGRRGGRPSEWHAEIATAGLGSTSLRVADRPRHCQRPELRRQREQ